MFGKETSFAQLRRMALEANVPLPLHSYRRPPKEKIALRHRRVFADDEGEDYADDKERNRVVLTMGKEQLNDEYLLQTVFARELASDKEVELGVGTVVGDKFIPCFDCANGIDINQLVEALQDYRRVKIPGIFSLDFSVYSTGKGFHVIGDSFVDGNVFKQWLQMLTHEEVVDQKWLQFFDKRNDFVLRISAAAEGRKVPVLVATVGDEIQIR